MVKIDLITGFLGAGKTTFIKKYAHYLLEKGLRIGILENDFGAVNVDMMLLQELEGENCELEMVSGGCDADCHRRRFRTKLIAMGMCGYDRVIVEPSGIYDVDEFFDALREEPLDAWYEIGNVIAVVDAKLEEHLSKEADYLLASEAANAGKIILSHADCATEEEIAQTVAHLNRALETIKCPRRLDREILRKSAFQLTDADFADLLSCGYVTEAYQKMELSEKQGFDSVSFLNVRMTPGQLKDAAAQMMKQPACGNIFRVKGFVKDENGGFAELNATPEEAVMTRVPAGQEVVIVIGERLNQEEIGKFFTL